MVNIPQGFPMLSAPLVEPGTGMISRVWIDFFRNLWNRTGGSTGDDGFISGDIKAYAGAGIQFDGVASQGWLLCDGDAVSRVTYASLFAAIGIEWGAGDGTTTFNLPDLRGRVLVGTTQPYDNSFPVGATGGSSAGVSLTVANLPPHNHGINDPGHFHADLAPASNVTAGAAAGGVTTGNTAAASTGVSTQMTGSGAPFSVLPPYAVITYLIHI